MNILIIFNLLLNFTVAESLYSPGTCKDILPDMGEYISFMEEVGALWVAKSPAQAAKVYDVLAIRKLYQETTKDFINPIDNKIKEFICDCYTKNNNSIYPADSLTIRTYSEKNIKKLINSASDDYINLKMDIYAQQKADKITSAMQSKIDKIKMNSMYNMNRELNNTFNKKLNKAKRG